MKRFHHLHRVPQYCIREYLAQRQVASENDHPYEKQASFSEDNIVGEAKIRTILYNELCKSFNTNKQKHQEIRIKV